MRKVYFYMFVVLVLLADTSYAQVKVASDSIRYRSMSVAFLPQHLLNQSVRVDIEKPVGARWHRLTLSPYLYAGVTSRYQYQKNSSISSSTVPDDVVSDRVDGLGLELSLKRLIRSGTGKITPWYIAYGGAFHHIVLKYQNFVPAPFQEGDLTYYRYTMADQREAIDRVELMAMLGVKLFLFDAKVLFLDLYAGPVYKKSWITAHQEVVLRHEEPTDFGFSGVTYQSGAGLGIILY